MISSQAILATKFLSHTHRHFPELDNSCSGHPKTCKSIKNRISKICTKGILSSTYIEESKNINTVNFIEYRVSQIISNTTHALWMWTERPAFLVKLPCTTWKMTFKWGFAFFACFWLKIMNFYNTPFKKFPHISFCVIFVQIKQIMDRVKSVLIIHGTVAKLVILALKTLFDFQTFWSFSCIKERDIRKFGSLATYLARIFSAFAKPI